MEIKKNKTLHIGLLSAMPEELGTILENLEDIVEEVFGDLKIYRGTFRVSNNKKILITTAWSGWGKVSAARATTRIISHSKLGEEIDFLIFTGLAGAVDEKLNQWDIIIGDSVMQHDMDASPIFNKFVIPALKKDKLTPCKNLLEKTTDILRKKESIKYLERFGSIKKGLIATGDEFISDYKKLEKLAIDIPKLLCVEMEGGAFAQVASQENMSWIILRVISDGANESAAQVFTEFVNDYKIHSWNLIKTILINL